MLQCGLGRALPWALLGALSCALSCGPVQAQQVPDAGSLLRQLQPQQPALPAPKAAQPAGRAAAGAATTAAIRVRAFRFEGNHLLTPAELARVAAPYAGRDLVPADLARLTDDLVRRYRRAGYLARVIVPAQRIEGGVLRLTVVEAHVGQVRFSRDTNVQDLNVRADRILARVQSQQQQGAPVYLPELTRGVLLASDLPGLSVSAREVAGATTGTTDVELSAHNTPVITGDFSLDNYGQPATGSERAVGRVDWNSAFGFGEQLQFLGLITPHLQYGRLDGSFPLNDDGSRLNLSASGLDYQVVTPQYQLLQPRGGANTFAAALYHPLVRDTDHNLSIGATLQRISPINEDVWGVVSDYHIYEATVHATANAYDGFHGGAITTASLALGNGWLMLAGSPNEALDAYTAHTAGHFLTLRYSLDRDQSLGGRFSLYLSLEGQYGSRNLDTTEQIYLSGPTGVAAYAVSDNAGSDGQLGIVELRWAGIRARWCRCTLKALYDVGHVTVYADPHFPGAPPPNSYDIQAAGVGANGELPGGLHFSLIVAHRVGGDAGWEAPQYHLTGAAQDTRVWGSLGWAF
ncbi:MAG TPA: POTRA domain-containing protein [Steroidobacteraceae bacterium]|nr:POTRA domain-containing protein [Steroidobacteraceae bacterium]